MGAELFLTDEQLVRLTKKVQRGAQMRALRFMGIEHRQRPDGSIAVTHAHINQVFGGEPASTRKTPTTQPNWDAI